MWFQKTPAKRIEDRESEVIWLGSKATLDILSWSTCTESVRDLGAYLDFELNVRAHIAKITQACFYQIRRLRLIRCLLGRDITANFVASFLLSRLDYCNTLFAALPYTSMVPLQRVINAAA